MKITQHHWSVSFGEIAPWMSGEASPTPPLLIWRDTITTSDDYLLKDINRHEDFFALFIVQRGRGMHVIEDVSYAISRGDVYIMGMGATHYYRQCKDLEIQAFYYTREMFDDATRQSLANIPGITSLIPGLICAEKGANRAGRWLHLTPTAYEQVADEVSKLNAEWKSRPPGNAIVLRAMFICLLIHLARFQAEAHPLMTSIRAMGHDATITTAIRIMEERYAEALRIEDIADAVSLSYNRFTQVFSQAVGQTPSAYLRLIRIERAKTLLSATQLSITAIAGQAGFSDPAYFARSFRATTGITPSDYRHQTKASTKAH